MAGTVYLVGAGPGDPGLLTLRPPVVESTVRTIVYVSSVKSVAHVLGIICDGLHRMGN